MPKLEPIVNQEPKDQLVPTFNKKEVVEIVNKGIQDYKESLVNQIEYELDNENYLLMKFKVCPEFVDIDYYVGNELKQERWKVARNFLDQEAPKCLNTTSGNVDETSIDNGYFRFAIDYGSIESQIKVAQIVIDGIYFNLK